MEIAYPATPGVKENWFVNFVMRDQIVAGLVHRKGDLVMSLDTGGGETIYYRTLRKLPD